MNRLRWLWLTPVAFFGLRVLGGQLVEGAVDQRDAPEAFASSLLANAKVFSVGMYLAGLSGLAFLWFAWALREKLRQEDTAGVAEAVAFGSALAWGTLTVAAAVLGATAPVLAEHYNDPAGARFVMNLEFAAAPLALTLLGAFAVGNGLALRRSSLVPSWLAWTGAVVGCLLIVTATLQPIAEPTVSRSAEEVHNIVSFLSGLASFALVPLWTIAVGVALLRRDGRTPGDVDRQR